MATLAKRLPLILATLVLSTTLLGLGAYAAEPVSDATITATVANDPAQAALHGERRADRDRDRDRDGDHHRRVCVKLNEVLSRLVDNGVITREQKARIMDAFNCVPDDRSDRPDQPSPQPTAAPTTAAG